VYKDAQVVQRPPVAFMSYVHADDKYGDLSTFRERLSDEVSAQIGTEFRIFQDRIDIGWGQQWRERIEESLDAVSFLVPIITPRFFGSEPCRAELRLFLERETKMRRNDLILPIYFIEHPPLNEPSSQATDELLRVVASHQYADWRDLRFEPFTSPQVRKRLEQMAIQIRAALERAQTLPNPGSTDVHPTATTPGQREPAASGKSTAEDVSQKGPSDQTAQPPAPKTEPRTRIVDPLYRGDHSTIGAAIEAAEPGDRILIRPGLFHEGLVIDKPLEIIGDGKPGEVVIRATGQDAIIFKTTMGRVANVVLRQTASSQTDEVWYGVDITQGRLELEDCDITSQSGACVAIRGGADPRLRRNRIHDGKSTGVSVHDNGQGGARGQRDLRQRFFGSRDPGRWQSHPTQQSHPRRNTSRRHGG
jgi:TIR domain